MKLTKKILKAELPLLRGLVHLYLTHARVKMGAALDTPILDPDRQRTCDEALALLAIATRLDWAIGALVNGECQATADQLELLHESVQREVFQLAPGCWRWVFEDATPDELARGRTE